ncbi:hypothetical protein DFP73DRAFT_568164 [Morchella snyderi]|nr:hypothetical protein DFP73DRAFT_568164 [Morchella snyderi]
MMYLLFFSWWSLFPFVAPPSFLLFLACTVFNPSFLLSGCFRGAHSFRSQKGQSCLPAMYVYELPRPVLYSILRYSLLPSWPLWKIPLLLCGPSCGFRPAATLPCVAAVLGWNRTTGWNQQMMNAGFASAVSD